MTGGIHPYDDLKAYCDGELTLTRRLTVRLHLARCASCREEILFMQQLGDDLRPSGAATLDPDLRARVLMEAANTPPIPPAPTSILQQPRRAPRGALVWSGALGVIALCAVLVSVFNPAGLMTREISSTPVGSMAQPALPGNAPAAAPAMPPVSEHVPTHSAAKQIAMDSQAAGVASAPAQISSNGAGAPAFEPPFATLNSLGEDPLRRVHKEANLTVQVTDPEEKSDEVAQITRDIGGYVGSNNLSTDGSGAKTAELVVNVPEPQFEAFIAHVSKLGSVTAKQITGEDITQKVSDADQAQQVLEDEAQRAEARLQMLGKHSRWDDVEQARDLRIQLAQARARLQLLKKMGTLSTVTIDLTEKPKPPAPVQTGLLPGLHDTSQQALQSLGASLGVLLSLAIWIIAYAPIWIPILLIGRWAYRTYFQHGTKTPA